MPIKRIFGFGRPAEPAEQPGSVELISENAGYQKSVGIFNIEGKINNKNTVILKLVKKGNLYTAFCSADGKNFETVGTANIVLKDIRAGLMACNGIMPAGAGGFGRFFQPNDQPDTPFEVAFDYFHIMSSGQQ